MPAICTNKSLTVWIIALFIVHPCCAMDPLKSISDWWNGAYDYSAGTIQQMGNEKRAALLGNGKEPAPHQLVDAELPNTAYCDAHSMAEYLGVIETDDFPPEPSPTIIQRMQSMVTLPKMMQVTASSHDVTPAPATSLKPQNKKERFWQFVRNDATNITPMPTNTTWPQRAAYITTKEELLQLLGPIGPESEAEIAFVMLDGIRLNNQCKVQAALDCADELNKHKMIEFCPQFRNKIRPVAKQYLAHEIQRPAAPSTWSIVGGLIGVSKLPPMVPQLRSLAKENSLTNKAETMLLTLFEQ